MSEMQRYKSGKDGFKYLKCLKCKIKIERYFGIGGVDWGVQELEFMKKHDVECHGKAVK